MQIHFFRQRRHGKFKGISIKSAGFSIKCVVQVTDEERGLKGKVRESDASPLMTCPPREVVDKFTEWRNEQVNMESQYKKASVSQKQKEATREHRKKSRKPSLMLHISLRESTEAFAMFLSTSSSGKLMRCKKEELFTDPTVSPYIDSHAAYRPERVPLAPVFEQMRGG